MVNNQNASYSKLHVLLEQRLRCFHLMLEMIMTGSCKQCHSNHVVTPHEHHLQFRAAGIANMRDNRERFIESSIENS